MGIEEHTVRISLRIRKRWLEFLSQLFSARSARTYLDCGYTQCFGAASAKERIDVAIRDAINNGDIVRALYLCADSLIFSLPCVINSLDLVS
jgi:hypothetical protein